MPGHLGPQRESEGHWDIGPFVLRIPEQHRVEDSFVSLGEKLAARGGRPRDGHPLGWWVIEVSAQEWISTDVAMEAERLWRSEQPVVGSAHERHLNEAIEVLARVNKLQRDTVNEYPEVQWMRTITRRERDLSILELLRTRPDLSQKEIGRMFDVSVSTVGRIGRNGNAKSNVGRSTEREGGVRQEKTMTVRKREQAMARRSTTRHAVEAFPDSGVDPGLRRKRGGQLLNPRRRAHLDRARPCLNLTCPHTSMGVYGRGHASPGQALTFSQTRMDTGIACGYVIERNVGRVKETYSATNTGGGAGEHSTTNNPNPNTNNPNSNDS